MTNPNTMPQNLQHFIQFLQSNNFKAERPNCYRRMNLSETALFDAENFTPEAKELLKERSELTKYSRPLFLLSDYTLSKM